ncbi:MAG TPA: response regulator [Blastocatellia bacterium]|nr:response regulator [Blastocatellia bacterium]
MTKVGVLVVEDQPDFVELMRLVLEGEGYYVSTAEDGEKAIAILRNFRPAIIVTDLMMPKVTGVELIRHVRRERELAGIPIIAVSAARGSLLDEAKQAGATETVKKPLDFETLVEVLSRYVPPPSSISGAPEDHC